jgi:hypothetical protein
VQALQTQLKLLGYYNGLANGQYQESTEIAASKFQRAKSLTVDGIAGNTTRKSLQAAVAAKKALIASSFPAPTAKPSTQPKPTQQGSSWWPLLGLGVLGSIGTVFYWLRWMNRVKPGEQPTISEEKTENAANKDAIAQTIEESDSTADQHESNTATASISTKLLPPEKTSRLAKLNIVDELIKDLYSADPAKRHKAIWDLGQQGDSRAIQPLIDLMMNADSQQHSLILAALSEISIRTLKPMNRALAISIQDESPQVRQNAIRDLTRVYDMMAQISQILRHGLEDPDAEVQSTARYALNHINRIRVLPDSESLPEHQQQDPSP